MKQLLIIGAGFAGMYAALAAARLRDTQGVSPDMLEITIASPEPRLVIRPRLYERSPETMVAPLAELFEAIDVRYVRGQVDLIDPGTTSVAIVQPDGVRRSPSRSEHSSARTFCCPTPVRRRGLSPRSCAARPSSPSPRRPTSLPS